MGATFPSLCRKTGRMGRGYGRKWSARGRLKPHSSPEEELAPCYERTGPPPRYPSEASTLRCSFWRQIPVLIRGAPLRAHHHCRILALPSTRCRIHLRCQHLLPRYPVTSSPTALFQSPLQRFRLPMAVVRVPRTQDQR